jgi:hypothetical protein
MGITNPDVYFAFTFDLQKSLSHPKLSIFIVYQKCDMPIILAEVMLICTFARTL